MILGETVLIILFGFM